MKEKTDTALNTYVKLLKAESSLSSKVAADETAASGLTMSQFGVLEALYHKGDLSAKQLSEKILKTKGNLTLVIDNLQRKGLVERRVCERDRRKTYICLTSEGRELIQEAFPRHARKIFYYMNVLSTEELQMLGMLCEKLGKGVEEI